MLAGLPIIHVYHILELAHVSSIFEFLFSVLLITKIGNRTRILTRNDVISSILLVF